MDNNVKLSEIYGMNVFNDAVMRERLPKATYKALMKTIEEGIPLEATVAEVVANAMKDWAVSKGATHFTHWFQPMTGKTAEKYEAFFTTTTDGHAIMEFSGKELIKGEADGSSFPSGGTRQTFEARGYTVWDCTSPAFLKEDASGVALCIPTAFYSHHGEALDKKTPLLRSMEAISKQALRVVRLMGNTTARRVITTVGAEQEYFLIDKRLYQQRDDLIFTGRTLFGAKPPKAQEMEDHYYGSIKEKISSFMKEIDVELWKIGVPSKTKHNEVAPAQHELAPLYATTNVATDQNQLVMETLQKVANRHELACLLHEKPFAGVNGSGKHNNWSLALDDGTNLLSPGKHPEENIQFLLFLAAIIKAVDMYAPLLRLTAATAGNDHRLGSNEAPPAIISMFLGDQLTMIIEEIALGHKPTIGDREILDMRVSTMPKLHKATTDRNRTSPFAFTGNKFEFRMFPSSGSIAEPNVVLNTIVADALADFADELEKVEDKEAKAKEIIKRTICEHKRIIFNGNGYCNEWVEEAEKRGLPHYKSTVDVIPTILSEESIRVFERFGVYSEVELHARYEMMLEEYCKTVNIESKTMVYMVRRQIIPAAVQFTTNLAQNIREIQAVGAFDLGAQLDILKEATAALTKLKGATDHLETITKEAYDMEDMLDEAKVFRNSVLPAMEQVRETADYLETIMDENIWPLPTYAELLLRI